MHLQGMTIALRQRMPWEATDLGIALVREHGRRIFAAWCLVTLPVWLLVNALGLAIDAPWVALLIMWWLKPMFDRVPLYAISRAVFGQAPGTAEIVRAQIVWGWRGIGPWLLWRRLHPGRLLLLPVDLLEHATGAQRKERVRVLTKGDSGPRNQIIALGMEFELLLSVALVLLVLLFVPTQFLSDAAASVYRNVFQQPPTWAKIALNACIWFGTSMVEPFVVGAGFGLYLNRRVQLEAWDVEHAFRRMAARLARAAQPLCVLLVLGSLAIHPASATPVPSCLAATTVPATGRTASPSGNATLACPAPGTHAESTPKPLPELFGAGYRKDGAAFAGQVQRARAGLFTTERDWVWVPKHRDIRKETSPPLWVESISNFVAFIARFGLWIVAAVVLGFILYHHKVWMRWVRELKTLDSAAPVESKPLLAPATLPDDIPAAVRALWQRGEQRAALALLYQASVQRLADGLGTPMPPGATEGECLARSRKLRDRRYAGLFAKIVGCWQAAAYARRMPEPDVLDGLLDEWARPATVVA